MITYIPVILICSSLLPHYECKEGKRDVTTVIGEMQNTPMACMMDGYERAAKLAFAPKENDKYYISIKCVPRKEFR